MRSTYTTRDVDAIVQPRRESTFAARAVPLS
jgi:hypothetical protein